MSMIPSDRLFLNLSTLTFSGTQILLFALFPFIAARLNLALPSVIAAFTLGTALFLVGAPFWSAQSEKMGKRKVLTIGLGGLFGSFFLISLMVSFADSMDEKIIFPLLILARVIYGALASSIVPMSQGIRSDEAKEHTRMKAMFSHSLYLGLGRTLGPLLLLAFTGRVELLLWTLSALCGTLFLSGVAKTNGPGVLSSSKLEDKINWRDSFKEAFWPLSLTILFTTYMGILHSSLGGKLQEKFLLDEVETSALMARLLLAGGLAMFFTHLLGRKFLSANWKVTLVSGVGLLSLGAILLDQVTLLNQLWPTIILISAGLALIQPSNLTALHRQGGQSSINYKIGLLASGNVIGYSLGGGLAAVSYASIQIVAVPVIVLLGLVTLILCRWSPL